MRKSSRHLVAMLACLAMASSSTAAFAADSSASWSALTALSTSADSTNAEQSKCSSHRDGYKDPCGYFGGWIPLGVIIGAGILAIILASGHRRSGGRGFSPN